MVTLPRLLGVVVAAALALAGWGLSGRDPGSAPVDVGADLASMARPGAEPAVSSTTAPPPPTTVPVVTTTTVAVDEHETTVATATPAVEYLETFDAPGGELVYFEYAITNPTYFGNPLVLWVLETSDDGEWLKVQVPVRPNGTEAWVRASDMTLSTHRFHAEINVTARSVKVWNGEDLLVETDAVVGKDQTPTPLGRFYVNDLVEKWDDSAFGPYILSLSGFSEALETFNGGVPVIAIHGTNRPELLGGAHSNGCIRIPNEIITVLADTVPMGTPVEIVA